jgi:hypothetical protein
MAVKDVQDFLFHFPSWQHVSPRLLLPLASKVLHIMPNLAQKRFGLFFDLFDQQFLSAHDSIIHNQPPPASWKKSQWNKWV